MNAGHFYFIKEEFFDDFSEPLLMKNREETNNKSGKRPCYYAFKDSKADLFWMIPISSKVEKYKAQYLKKMKINNRCDTIAFGNVLGHEKAFLIQNMFPIIEDYIDAEYFDRNSQAVRVEGNFEKSLLKKARKVLMLERQGIKLIFPDILLMELELERIRGRKGYEKNTNTI